MKKTTSMPAATAAGPGAPADPADADHRTRTGALRREQTRRKLLAAALAVFADKGPESTQIEDVIAAAGVARGTFYNYFDTMQALLDAVTAELSDRILARIDAVVLRIDDPLLRLATGCLLYMHAGIDVPNLGAFLVRTGMRGDALGRLVDLYLPRDLESARSAGKMDFPTLRAARDMLLAAINQAMQTVHEGAAPREHLRQVMAVALRGLGVPAARAARLSALPLPEIGLPDALQSDRGGTR
ncbi:MAG TPA: TetR/AcrR family transcriptional regulator [Rubrivivax sp.]|nr:TetR/AcrR family transcriptional regulator [Rubrivivax sp.]